MTTGLVLIHAFPLDSSMWQEERVGFQDRLPVLAPDLPGFGGTGSAGDVMTMNDGAERCVHQMDDAGLDDAVVCGLSMGGYIAFQLWRIARSRIRGLILANTRSGADGAEAAAARRALAERLLAEGSGFLVANPPPLLSAGASPELGDRVKALIAAQPAASIAAAALGLAERVDSTPDLAGIDVPTLIVTSEQDTLISPDVTSPMAEQIAGAELAVIQGAGHLSNLEQPIQFHELVSKLLLRCGIP